MREPEVLGHLLTERWASVRFGRHSLSLRLGIRFSREHVLTEAMARPRPRLLCLCFLWWYASAENRAYAEGSAYADARVWPRQIGLGASRSEELCVNRGFRMDEVAAASGSEDERSGSMRRRRKHSG